MKEKIGSFVLIAACILAVFSLFGQSNNDSFSFIQLCDTQLGMTNYQEDSISFETAVKQINQMNPDLVLICGDLVNKASGNTFNDFNAIKSGFNMPCFCVAGNHDVLNEPNDSSLSLYREYIGDDFYEFKHKGVTFVIINTQLWESSVDEELKKHEKWVYETINKAGSDGNTVIVAGHYPLFPNSSEKDEGYFKLSREKRLKLLELFSRNNTIAYLSGHMHKLVMDQYNEIQLVSGETTSLNLDERPKGFRLWKISKEGLTNTFVPLAKN